MRRPWPAVAGAMALLVAGACSDGAVDALPSAGVASNVKANGAVRPVNVRTSLT